MTSIQKENVMTETFVLIHGSWHGGWAWQAVMRALAVRGHRAYAPTLPGHGPNPDRVGITHAGCVTAVVADIRQHGLRDITLVGHSFGGSVIQKVAEAIPERIKRLVFVDAFVLADGESIYDNLPEPLIALLDQLAAASGDDTTLLPWEVWRDHFIQDAPEMIARALWELLSPEPNRVNVEKLDLKRFYALDIPATYIVLRHDQSLPPGSFHPRMSARLGGPELIEIDGSHEVMFTHPVALADALIAASNTHGPISAGLHPSHEEHAQ
jgi:pimeloyl-ACP methyl ester carboxylesterase